MKYILLIPDGLGDKPVPELGRKTPLEAADTPHMDFFAARGQVGTSRNIPEGFIPGTDVGCMSVFGYDPRKYFTGRGPLEAAEVGVVLKKNEVVFRCNLVTVDNEILKDFSADHVSTAEAKSLLEVLNQKLEAGYAGQVRFYAGKGTGYRNLMVYSGADAAVRDARCTPPHDIMGRGYKRHLPDGPNARLLAELMERSRELFRDHPVNRRRRRDGKGEASMIWLWGQGTSPSFPSYYEKYGLHGAVITAVDLVKGIAIHAGLDVVRVPGVTGYFDTNYAGKAEYAINTLRSRDFVAVHVESTDEAGHIGDPRLKIRAIEDVDRLVLGTLRQNLKEFGDFKIMVLPDHYTCVGTRTHSPDPVPFLIYSSKAEQKGPEKFCEKSAEKTGFKMEEGHRMMDFFVRTDHVPKGHVGAVL